MLQFFLALCLLATSPLMAEVAVGTSLENLEILHEEHFPRPPFVMYFGATWSHLSEHNHEVLSTLSDSVPVFYVFVEDPTAAGEYEQGPKSGSYPVVIHDSYGSLCEEIGVHSIPTTLLIGDRYVVEEIFTGPIDSGRVMAELEHPQR